MQQGGRGQGDVEEHGAVVCVHMIAAVQFAGLFVQFLLLARLRVELLFVVVRLELVATPSRAAVQIEQFVEHRLELLRWSGVRVLRGQLWCVRMRWTATGRTVHRRSSLGLLGRFGLVLLRLRRCGVLLIDQIVQFVIDVRFVWRFDRRRRFLRDVVCILVVLGVLVVLVGRLLVVLVDRLLIVGLLKLVSLWLRLVGHVVVGDLVCALLALHAIAERSVAVHVLQIVQEAAVRRLAVLVQQIAVVRLVGGLAVLQAFRRRLLVMRWRALLAVRLLIEVLVVRRLAVVVQLCRRLFRLLRVRCGVRCGRVRMLVDRLWMRLRVVDERIPVGLHL